MENRFTFAFVTDFRDPRVRLYNGKGPSDVFLCDLTDLLFSQILSFAEKNPLTLEYALACMLITVMPLQNRGLYDSDDPFMKRVFNTYPVREFEKTPTLFLARGTRFV